MKIKKKEKTQRSEKATKATWCMKHFSNFKYVYMFACMLIICLYKFQIKHMAASPKMNETPKKKKIPVNTKKRKRKNSQIFGTQSLLTKNTTTWHETLHITTTKNWQHIHDNMEKKATIRSHTYTHKQTVINLTKWQKYF